MIRAEEFLRDYPVQSSDQAVSGAGDGSAGAEFAVGNPAEGERAARRGRLARRRRMPRRGGFGATASAAPAEPLDDPCDDDACREAALKLLDYSARSSGSLARRLSDKGYDESTVSGVIDRLTELGLLDDESFAASVIRSCVGRMMGPRGALEELTRKGVGRSMAARMVDEAERQGVFEDAAWELGRRVARKTLGMDRSVRYRRLWSAGSRKGHSPETLRRVAGELLSGSCGDSTAS